MSEFTTSLEPITFADLPEGEFEAHLREEVLVHTQQVDYYRLRMFRGEQDVGVCPVYVAHARYLAVFKVSEDGRWSGRETYLVDSEGIAHSAYLWYVLPRLLTRPTG